MEWQIVALMMVAAILLLVVTGLPVAVVLISVSLVFLVAVIGIEKAAFLLMTQTFHFWSHWTLLCIPLFIMMGEFLLVGGAATDIFDMAGKWLRRLPGGLALVSVVSCAVFGSMSGSTAGATSTMGLVACPQMLKKGYSPRLATGCIVAAGGLAHLIPPSILMIVYAGLVEISPGRALIAAFIPGFMLAGYYSLVTIIWAIKNPRAAPLDPPSTWKEKLVSLRASWQPVVIVAAVMGSLMAGVATATEAAGAGAILAILVAGVKQRLTWENILGALKGTVRVTCFILFLALGGKFLSLTLTYYMIPHHLVEFMVGLELGRMAIMGMIIGLYFLLGMFLDAIGAMVVTMPIVLPLVLASGFDAYWFGVLLMVNFEMAFVTPPFGPQCYILKGVCPEVPIQDIFLGGFIFLIADALMMVTLLLWPQLPLWLPGMVYG